MEAIATRNSSLLTNLSLLSPRSLLELPDHDADARAQCLGFLHIVGGEDHLPHLKSKTHNKDVYNTIIRRPRLIELNFHKTPAQLSCPRFSQ